MALCRYEEHVPKKDILVIGWRQLWGERPKEFYDRIDDLAQQVRPSASGEDDRGAPHRKTTTDMGSRWRVLQKERRPRAAAWVRDESLSPSRMTARRA